MKIDIDALLAEIAARNKGKTCLWESPARMVLDRIVHHGDIGDFRNFIARFTDSFDSIHLIGCDAMYGPRWMARFGPTELWWLYQRLVEADLHLKYTARVVADRRIAAEKRAYLCHAVFDASVNATFSPGMIVLPHFWWYNRIAFGKYVDNVRNNDSNVFIKRLDLGLAVPRFFDRPMKGVKEDEPAVFEIERELENRRISDSLMRMLAQYDAAKCFTMLMRRHPETVFKLRTPQEWLLAVCRDARPGFAAAAVREIERQFPGIAAETRDMWGNTLLWNTLNNDFSMDEAQNDLIRFGCDPDEENDLGLTYRLLRDNDPGKLCDDTWKRALSALRRADARAAR